MTEEVYLLCTIEMHCQVIFQYWEDSCSKSDPLYSAAVQCSDSVVPPPAHHVSIFADALGETSELDKVFCLLFFYLSLQTTTKPPLAIEHFDSARFALNVECIPSLSRSLANSPKLSIFELVVLPFQGHTRLRINCN
jgi:hypothetical protein